MTMMTTQTDDYHVLLTRKTLVAPESGVRVADDELNQALFPFQRTIVRWALRKGRCAVFADAGLGKTLIQLEWAHQIIQREGGRALIIAPLSVAKQTVRMGARFGYDVHYTRRADDLHDGINITNYEMAHVFNPDDFYVVVLDESSILKSVDGKTRKMLTEQFNQTHWRMCCTATPAPNDITEIANHAEFLGVMTRLHILAKFFVKDEDGYRLKRPATKPFYRWLASWAIAIRKPSDIGFSDEGYDLPPLEIEPIYVKSDYVPESQLVFTGLKGIQDRTAVRRKTQDARIDAALDYIHSLPADSQVIAWCGLNSESAALSSRLSSCIEVTGTDSADNKELAYESFLAGNVQTLVTKAPIAGWGMNFQNASEQVFIGLNDSQELFYQAVRRSWRFGQTKRVRVRIVLSDIEAEIYSNVMRKEAEAKRMIEGLVNAMHEYELEELEERSSESYTYTVDDASGDGWRIMLGDSVERMREISDESVGLSVHSPPFISLYTYSPTPRDIGNSNNEAEFNEHYGFIVRELYRITKPGRIAAVHVMQVPATLVNDGFIGLKDFRGQVIELFKSHGWIYYGEAVIPKNPQAQAIRTRAKGLGFQQLHKDSSWSRPGLLDFVLVFRKDGVEEAVDTDIDNDTWIEWAGGIWGGIRESDTLQYTTARDKDDERHIAPLQRGVVERCIRLWSNKGDIVFDPFTGIGTTGHVALKWERKFLGCELKPSYWRIAVKNLREANVLSSRQTLFDAPIDDESDPIAEAA